ncbi:glutamate receptor [Senna tora]|uniref:Glutamate receptor n=1 Tax=Senna tora TaxID=362788 RepID=A0A834SMT4_9FABA|nr:glutamate receptor [Senna tora]
MTIEVGAQLIHCKTAQSLWEGAIGLTCATTKSRVMMFKGELHQTQKNSLKMAEYLSQIKIISNQLALAGAPVSSDYLIFYTLNGLNAEYNPVREKLIDRDDLTWIDVTTTLLACEARIEQQNRFSTLSVQPSANSVQADSEAPKNANAITDRNPWRGSRFLDRRGASASNECIITFLISSNSFNSMASGSNKGSEGVEESWVRLNVSNHPTDPSESRETRGSMAGHTLQQSQEKVNESRDTQRDTRSSLGSSKNITNLGSKSSSSAQLDSHSPAIEFTSDAVQQNRQAQPPIRSMSQVTILGTVGYGPTTLPLRMCVAVFESDSICVGVCGQYSHYWE